MRQTFQRFGQEFRRNRRLQWGLAVIAMVLLADGGTRWKERIEAAQQRLAQLQIELATLKRQAKNEGAMSKALLDARRASELADARLWVATSEAVGQARVKDWLTELLKKSGVSNFSVNLTAAKPMAVAPEVPPDSARPLPTKDETGGLFEFGAASTFPFTPESLEKVLASIEAGEPLARVESLSVRRNDRRVEMGIRVLIRLKGDTP
ncbi:MAG: hypothetical protein AB7I35_07870 [Ramlibacter sp.]